MLTAKYKAVLRNMGIKSIPILTAALMLCGASQLGRQRITREEVQRTIMQISMHLRTAVENDVVSFADGDTIVIHQTTCP
jgi:hypothetical protein